MTAKKEKPYCQGRVWNGWSHASCLNGASMEHEGKYYCKTHHPPTVEAKRKARNEKWQADWDLQQTKSANEAARKAEIQRRAACFDDLLAALVDMVEIAESQGHICKQARAAINKATQQE